MAGYAAAPIRRYLHRRHSPSPDEPCKVSELVLLGPLRPPFLGLRAVAAGFRIVSAKAVQRIYVITLRSPVGRRLSPNQLVRLGLAQYPEAVVRVLKSRGLGTGP